MFHQIFLQNVLLMILAGILIKTEADQWGVYGGHTPFFWQIIIKSALN